jgi:hypothetical protein
MNNKTEKREILYNDIAWNMDKMIDLAIAIQQESGFPMDFPRFFQSLICPKAYARGITIHNATEFPCSCDHQEWMNGSPGEFEYKILARIAKQMGWLRNEKPFYYYKPCKEIVQVPEDPRVCPVADASADFLARSSQ